MARVSLVTEATDRSVGIVSAVASGAGESLQLPLEPATRLNAIAIEAASNVVAHAYPDRPGPFELEIQEGDASGPETLTVAVRDNGEGILATTTREDPPGLGLTVIYSLADQIEIRTTPSGGTSLAATIEAGRNGAPSPDLPSRPGGTLTFIGSTFLESVLPRTLAALVAGSTTAIDALVSVLHVGDALAYGLGSVVAGEASASVRWDDDAPNQVRIGPFDDELNDDLRAAIAVIEPRCEAWLSTEPATSGAGGYALVDLPST